MSRYPNPLTLMLVILIMPCAGVAQTASLGFIGGIQGAFVFPPITPAFETATGYRALRRNTTGGENTASGVSALDSNTTGGSNTASTD